MPSRKKTSSTVDDKHGAETPAAASEKKERSKTTAAEDRKFSPKGIAKSALVTLIAGLCAATALFVTAAVFESDSAKSLAESNKAASEADYRLQDAAGASENYEQNIGDYNDCISLGGTWGWGGEFFDERVLIPCNDADAQALYDYATKSMDANLKFLDESTNLLIQAKELGVAAQSAKQQSELFRLGSFVVAGISVLVGVSLQLLWYRRGKRN